LSTASKTIRPSGVHCAEVWTFDSLVSFRSGPAAPSAVAQMSLFSLRCAVTTVFPSSLTLTPE
jgi:hypothetical protein